MLQSLAFQLAGKRIEAVSKDEARSYLKMRMKKHAGKMLGMVLETNRSSPDEWPSRRAVL